MTRNTHLSIKLKTPEDIDNAISILTKSIHIEKKKASFPANKFKSDHLITSEIEQLTMEKRKARNFW